MPRANGSITSVIILAVGDRVWGRGKTITEAIDNMNKEGKSKYYQLYVAQEGTYVDGLGFVFDQNAMSPVLIHEVKPAKKMAKGKRT